MLLCTTCWTEHVPNLLSERATLTAAIVGTHKFAPSTPAALVISRCMFSTAVPRISLLPRIKADELRHFRVGGHLVWIVRAKLVDTGWLGIFPFFVCSGYLLCQLFELDLDSIVLFVYVVVACAEVGRLFLQKVKPSRLSI